MEGGCEGHSFYYHASESHRPAVADVDGNLERKLADKTLKRVRKRRAIRIGVVETLVEKGEMQLIGDGIAVEVKDCFMKMPMEVHEKKE